MHGNSSQYNIYKDPAPSECAKALQVVERLVAKVEEFLAEWPDHPTLIQVLHWCCCKGGFVVAVLLVTQKYNILQ